MFDNVMTPVIGGAMIGLASALMLLLQGRIAGISGIVGGFMMGREKWRGAFIVGLVAGGLSLALFMPQVFATPTGRSLPAIAVAGLLVGIGTRLGNGCTSGHGVCGIGRMSKRGIAATLTFMATGIATASAVRVLAGGSL